MSGNRKKDQEGAGTPEPPRGAAQARKPPGGAKTAKKSASTAKTSKAAAKPDRPTATKSAKTPKTAAKPGQTTAPKSAGKKPPQRPAFRRGNWGVYPSHGPGRVAGTRRDVVAGRKVEFLVVEFAREKMALKIPKDRLEESGLRPISSAKAIRVAMNKLKEPAHVKRSMWSRRAQEYESKLHSGDLVQIAEVLRDLYRAPEGPEQSFSERELYKDALDRFSREIAAAENIPLDRACARLELALKKAA